jgi:uncharacterized protein YecT (DUF1311 family)
MPLIRFLTSVLFFACLSVVVATNTDDNKIIVVGQDTIAIESRVVTYQGSECEQMIKLYCYRKKAIADTQFITEDCFPCSPHGSNCWYLVDVTFDGIPEVMHSTTEGSTNNWEEVYRWDKDSLKFTLIGEFENLHLDSQKKTIESYSKIRMAAGPTTIYKWIDNKFRITGQYDGNDGESGIFCSTVYDIPDSTMTYRKTCRNIEGDSISNVVSIIEQQGYCKDVNAFVKYERDVYKKKESLVVIGNDTVKLNIGNEYLKADSLLNKTFSEIKETLPKKKKEIFIKMEREWIKSKDAGEKKILNSELDTITTQYRRFIFLINETKNRESRLKEIADQIKE